MREYAAAAATAPSSTGNLTDDVVANATAYGTAVGFRRRVDDGWDDVSWAEFLADVTAVGRGLVALGVTVGDRVALQCRTRYEWSVVDYAIWFAGGVGVPLYETAGQDQVRWILSDSAAVLAIVETAGQQATVEAIRADLPGLRDVRCLDAGGLAHLVAAGLGVPDAELAARRTATPPAGLATIIYTSGTTGPPKGCRLTHQNLMAEIDAATRFLPEVFTAADASTLVFLPLAHVFARVVAIGCVRTRIPVGHTSDIRRLMDDLESLRPTFLLAVPRVFEKVFNAASGQAASDGRGAVFDAAVGTAVAFSVARDRGRIGPVLRSRHAVFDRMVYARLRSRLGGRLRYAISGGAPLGERLAHFYRGAGVPVLEGYGLTETTAALTVNRPGAHRIGSVGQPLPGTSLRLADDGELLAKGPQVFGGYWGDAVSSDAVLVDGWLHTGDIGELDDDGFLRITGRKQEILVTAGGKSVAPAVLEERLRAHPLIAQAMVVGDGRPYVAALVTLDSETLKARRRHRRRSRGMRDPVRDPGVHAEIQAAVDEANAVVSRAEAIRTFVIVDGEWSEAGGELTPTLRLRRSVVMRKFHDQVESLYS